MDLGDDFGFEAGTIAVTTNGEVADLLGNLEGVFGVFEGFGVDVLTIHEDETMKIGIKTVFAQTEKEIEIFGWSEERVVPGEVFGEQTTADHDTGVLKRIGSVHEIVNTDMSSREDFFAGDTVIFVDGKALTTHNNNSGMGEKELHLFEKAVGE